MLAPAGYSDSLDPIMATVESLTSGTKEEFLKYLKILKPCKLKKNN